MVFRGRGRRRQTGSAGRRLPVRALAVRTSRAVNASRPRAMARNRQLLSTPNHCYSLKIQRMFRLVGRLTNAAPKIDLTLSEVMTGVRQELGVTAGTDGESFAIHTIRVYGAIDTAALVGSSTTASESLTTFLFDVEETGGTNANLIDRQNDICSMSGIANLGWVYPVNNRPTFSRTNTGTTVLASIQADDISSGQQVRVAIDMLIDYTRVPLGDPTPVLARSSILPPLEELSI